jgi:hypothetical protein
MDRAARSSRGTTPRNPGGYLLAAITFDDGATFHRDKDAE